MRNAGVRAEVCATVPYMTAGLNDSGERLVEDGYPGGCLVVLEQYVLLRLVFLNQVVLEQESVLLIIDDNVVYMANLAYENSCLRRLFLIKEIRRHPPFEVLGLAYVDNLASLVEILIYARHVRQHAHKLLKVGETLIIRGVCIFVRHQVKERYLK